MAAGALLAATPLAPLFREAGGAWTVHRLFALLLIASMAEVLVFLGALGNAVQLAAGSAGLGARTDRGLRARLARLLDAVSGTPAD